MFNWRDWVANTDSKELRKVFDYCLKKAGYKVLGVKEFQFEPFGYSAIYLLSDSHFAVHTFPEEDKTYVELSSCIEGKQRAFMSLIQSKKIGDILAKRSETKVDASQAHQVVEKNLITKTTELLERHQY